MYLKRLEIQGFKSFADRVEFEFTQGVTAIVGPNGSGKSNVVDSIRWVLGEQSAKSLRGGKMDDVIFAGSTQRRPVGMAQVSMTLDNSAGLFPLEFAEVTISRRLYRSGESEYLINKTPCRLKDIHELFMDTGLGREGFSIISQGKVDEILSLRPEDRRGLIEEAAGIIKYKYRKREAERKLGETEENLLRLNDIVDELTKRVEPLGEQAEKAQQYKLWKKELDDLEITLEVQQLERNMAAEVQNLADLAVNEDKLAEVSAQYGTIEAKVEQDKLALQQLEQEINEQQEAFYVLQGQLEKRESDISLGTQLKATFAEQREKLLDEERYYQQEIARLSLEVETKVQGCEEMDKALLSAKEVYQALEAKLTQQTALIDAGEQILENAKDDSILNMQKQARCHNEHLRLIQQLDSGEKRLSRLGERQAKLRQEQEVLTCEVAAADEALTVLQQALAQSEVEQQEEHRALDRLQETQQQIKRENARLQSQYQQAHSRYQALKELEEAGDGYQLGVKSILEQKKVGTLSGIIGTVAQLLKVPDYLERAIETAVGQGLQNIVTASDGDAQSAIGYLKKAQKGRATFLPLNTIQGTKSSQMLKDDAVLGLAVDLVSFDPKYTNIMNYLLGRIWVAKDLKAAVELGKKKGFKERLVTLDGDLITPGGAMTGGNFARQKGGLLSRQRQIHELAQQAADLKAALAKAVKELADLEDAVVQKNKQLAQKQLLCQNQRLEWQQKHQEQEQRLKEKERLDKEFALEGLDYQELAAENADLQEKITMEEAKAQQIIAEKEQLEALITAQKEQLEILRRDKEQWQKEFQQQQVQQAADEQKAAMLAEQLADLKSRLTGLERQRQQKAVDILDLEQKDAAKAKEIAENKGVIQTLTVELKDQQEQLTHKRQIRIQKQTQVEDVETSGRLLQKQLEQLKEEKYRLDGTIERLKALKENALKRLAQTFGVTYDEALLCKVEIEDEKNALSRVTKLKGKIQGLGNINFNAIDEYQEVKERLTFLNEQMDDLQKAKASLGKVIKEMEEIMAKRFQETYQVVNATFAQVFSAMFAGGSARLELSDPKDYLLTGIEIVAQPPGKKEQILSLLSGGERAMTAIALLFALLTVKPSPFCILDEIEAALDEVNVDRFARFIRDYTHKTQFIVISHRKGTMEAADVLYGVAMENDGVSKLMSVKLSDYQ